MITIGKLIRIKSAKLTPPHRGSKIHFQEVSEEDKAILMRCRKRRKKKLAFA